jgi:hypothetical protein
VVDPGTVVLCSEPTDCARFECDPATAECVPLPINEGGPCVGDECTCTDETGGCFCADGVCIQPPATAILEPFCFHVPTLVPAGSPIPVVVYGTHDTDFCTENVRAEVEMANDRFEVRMRADSPACQYCPDCAFEFIEVFHLDTPGPGQYIVAFPEADREFTVQVTAGDVTTPDCLGVCTGDLGGPDWTLTYLAEHEQHGCGPLDPAMSEPLSIDGGCVTWTVTGDAWPYPSQIAACPPETRLCIAGPGDFPCETEATPCVDPDSGRQMLLGLHNGTWDGEGPAYELFLLEGEGGCVPDCEGRECGPDGCGGVCGTCPAGCGCVDGMCPGLVDVDVEILCHHVPSLVGAGGGAPVAVFGQIADATDHFDAFIEAQVDGDQVTLTVTGQDLCCAHDPNCGQYVTYDTCDREFALVAYPVLPNPGGYWVTLNGQEIGMVGASGGIIAEPACDDACVQPPYEDYDWTVTHALPDYISDPDGPPSWMGCADAPMMDSPVPITGSCQTYSIAEIWTLLPLPMPMPDLSDIFACTDSHLLFGTEAPYMLEATRCMTPQALSGSDAVIVGIANIAGWQPGDDTVLTFVVRGSEQP